MTKYSVLHSVHKAQYTRYILNMDLSRPVYAVVLDASPLLNNEPSISSLLAKSEKLFTIPSVVAEIKDKHARSRMETTVLPFLTIRDPLPASINFVTNFARKTGDLVVLSKPDINILALAYELECERNHGDWRLRKVPGQKGVNGTPPSKLHDKPATGSQGRSLADLSVSSSTPYNSVDPDQADSFPKERPLNSRGSSSHPDISGVSVGLETLEITEPADKISIETEPTDSRSQDLTANDATTPISDSSDSEGWITPANLKKQLAKDQNRDAQTHNEASIMQVATITGDFAMQNVLLQMNLNLLSSSMMRVRQLKTYILRCHACFEKTKDMTKQFCPRCGGPTLTRVSCSTSANGEFKIYLKKNMQWNTRGDRFSIPKLVSGSANGKSGTSKGGGKGGWGQELILAEDQKEYLKAMQGNNRKKERSLMDEDYLPGILTGERGRTGGRPRIGGGRNINSKRR